MLNVASGILTSLRNRPIKPSSPNHGKSDAWLTQTHPLLPYSEPDCSWRDVGIQ